VRIFPPPGSEDDGLKYFLFRHSFGYAFFKTNWKLFFTLLYLSCLFFCFVSLHLLTILNIIQYVINRIKDCAKFVHKHDFVSLHADKPVVEYAA
jgi:hypothetical protein